LTTTRTNLTEHLEICSFHNCLSHNRCSNNFSGQIFLAFPQIHNAARTRKRLAYHGSFKSVIISRLAFCDSVIGARSGVRTLDRVVQRPPA
jgi:hypothetical protein